EDAGADHRADAEHDQLGAGQGALERGFAFQAGLERLARLDVPRRLARVGGEKLLEPPIPQWVDRPRPKPGCARRVGAARGGPPYPTRNSGGKVLSTGTHDTRKRRAMPDMLADPPAASTYDDAWKPRANPMAFEPS